MTILGSRTHIIAPLTPPWTSLRRAVHLWIAALLGLRSRLLVLVSRNEGHRATSTTSADRSFAREATSVSARCGLRGGVEPRRMFLRYFTSTAELWAVKWGICQSIWPLELIVTMACVHASRRFTPVIAPFAPASQNAKNTIVALGVVQPLLRECVACLRLHRLLKI